jgi:uncharacterized protein YdeI (YjbR/CyaY-like superfamily)
MRTGRPLYVTTRRAWRAWLATHHAREREIWLVYPRRASGLRRIGYNEAVEEALCYGWIDSTVRSLDPERLAQRFTPRRPGSGLSPLNRERVRRLIAAKRMTRAGLAAIAHAFDPAQDQVAGPLRIAPDILRPLRADAAAWRNFRAFPAAYQRIRVGYLEGRRRHGPEAFARSLAFFIKMTAKNKRIGFVRG